MATKTQLQGVIDPVQQALVANQKQIAANNGLVAGVNTGANATKALNAANTAQNKYALAANRVGNIGNKNANAVRKAKLNIAQKHFVTAAIDSAANNPVKAATHARMGVSALKNYIGANNANRQLPS
jgi:hypothetical protein